MTDPDRPASSSNPYPRSPAGPPQDKSVGAALALTFFFGPIGLFYISVRGAIIMIVVSIVVALITLGIGLFIIWPISMVWSAVVASQKHQEFETWKVERLSGGGGAAML